MDESTASSVKSFLILTQALAAQSSHNSEGLPPLGILELCWCLHKLLSVVSVPLCRCMIY